MQRLPKRLVDGSQLTAVAVSYYATPANTLTTIAAMSVTNTTATARTVTVHLVPAAGSASASNCVCSARTVAPGETYNVAGAIGQTLSASGFISALADAATALTLVASGYETNP
jgi:vancomycin resistance protein YoaR